MLARADDDIAHARARLVALSPAATLRRGYAIVHRSAGAVHDRVIVRSAAQVAAGDKLFVRFSRDELAVTAAPYEPPAPAESQAPAEARAPAEPQARPPAPG